MSHLYVCVCVFVYESNYTKTLMVHWTRGPSLGKIPASVCLATITRATARHESVEYLSLYAFMQNLQQVPRPSTD